MTEVASVSALWGKAGVAAASALWGKAGVASGSAWWGMVEVASGSELRGMDSTFHACLARQEEDGRAEYIHRVDIVGM